MLNDENTIITKTNMLEERHNFLLYGEQYDRHFSDQRTKRFSLQFHFETIESIYVSPFI